MRTCLYGLSVLLNIVHFPIVVQANPYDVSTDLCNHLFSVDVPCLWIAFQRWSGPWGFTFLDFQRSCRKLFFWVGLSLDQRVKPQAWDVSRLVFQCILVPVHFYFSALLLTHYGSWNASENGRHMNIRSPNGPHTKMRFEWTVSLITAILFTPILLFAGVI